MFFTKEQLESLNKVLAPTSVNRYTTWLKKIQGDVFKLEELENDKEKMVKLILALKDKTQTMAAVLKVVSLFSKKKDVIKYYQDEFDKIKYNPDKALQEVKETNKDTLSVEDIYSIRRDLINEWAQVPNKDRLKLSNLKLALSYLLTVLYTEIPPLRGQDYFNTRIISKRQFNLDEIKKNKENVLVFELGKMYIVQGKRTNASNMRVLDLNKDVLTAVSNLLKILIKNKVPQDKLWLIPKLKSPSENMKTSGFNKFVKNLFGGNISTVYLRNLFVAYWLDQGMTRDELDEKARIMAHSPATQVLIYGKNSKRLHPEKGDTSEVEQLKREKEALQRKVEELEQQVKLKRGRPKKN